MTMSKKREKRNEKKNWLRIHVPSTLKTAICALAIRGYKLQHRVKASGWSWEQGWRTGKGRLPRLSTSRACSPFKFAQRAASWRREIYREGFAFALLRLVKGPWLRELFTRLVHPFSSSSSSTSSISSSAFNPPIFFFAFQISTRRTSHCESSSLFWCFQPIGVWSGNHCRKPASWQTNIRAERDSRGALVWCFLVRCTGNCLKFRNTLVLEVSGITWIASI